jgi:hypothetical protein
MPLASRVATKRKKKQIYFSNKLEVKLTSHCEDCEMLRKQISDLLKDLDFQHFISILKKCMYALKEFFAFGRNKQYM